MILEVPPAVSINWDAEKPSQDASQVMDIIYSAHFERAAAMVLEV